MSSNLQPINILNEKAGHEKNEMARLSAFVGARTIGEVVESTLGPNGMDKILLPMGKYEKMRITNDGATILKSLRIDNPAAKILIEVAKVQDNDVGDGTTSVTVLSAKLLEEAEKLIEHKIHPQTIIAGWKKCVDVACKALEESAIDYTTINEKFEKELYNIACTTLSSKILKDYKDKFAKLVVDVVLRLKGNVDLSAVQIMKVMGGTLNDSYLEEGFLLNKSIGINQPKVMKNCKIMVSNTAMDHDKIKVFSSRVKVNSIAKLADIEEAERKKMKDKVDKILKHGINVFINRQLIYNYPEQLFAQAGVMAIEHADFTGVERLALVTGAEIKSTFDEVNPEMLGYCDKIHEVQIGEETMIKFSGVKVGEACVIVLRGATSQILGEAKRSIHDALCVLNQTLQEKRTVCGGGCTEMLMANAVSRLAEQTTGKQAIVIESYAYALRQLPRIIADNCGMDSAEIVSTLRSYHANKENTMGIDFSIRGVGDMRKLGITESLRVKRQIVQSATECAEMITRVDNIIYSSPRERAPDRRC
ncbi:TCP-1-beta [Intoshia linei]|uniref:T-complex protein 1 subunit beta n=1 Tax=Intoshia linei TaxID=1819745 RepID=A0A177B9N2_9BILA|nr:TCP-1-beta [Intoshia linei]